MNSTIVTLEDLLTTYFYTDGAGKRGSCIEVYRRVKAAFDLLADATEPEAIEAALSILETGK